MALLALIWPMEESNVFAETVLQETTVRLVHFYFYVKKIQKNRSEAVLLHKLYFLIHIQLFSK